MKVIQVLNRFYVNDLDEAIVLYEKLLGVPCALRFKYDETRLELAQIGNILILSGSDQDLEPYRATKATFVVDSVTEHREHLIQGGAAVVRDIKAVPTGWNMTLRHSDGTIVEYVEFKKPEVKVGEDAALTLADIRYTQISLIKELWEKNRLYHEKTSEHFGHLYRGIDFEGRITGFSKFDEESLKISVAKDGDELIGYCISTAEGDSGELASLHVDQRYRGRGIGKQLSERHLEWIRTKGCKTISVTVSQENETTIAFYKGLGFLPNTLEMLMM